MAMTRIHCTQAALLLAACSIAGAWIIQLLGYEPCVLCLRQRVPYYTGVPILAVALVVQRSATWSLRQTGLVLRACALVIFGMSLLLAANHVGVEQGWWDGPASCVSRIFDTTSLDAFAAQLGSAQMVSCKTPTFTMLGFSLAWWNAAVSAAILALLSYEIFAGSRRSD